MIDDLVERLEANAALADVSVEQSDTNHYVRQFAQLGNLLWGCQ
jgi:hypothetical protein